MKTKIIAVPFEEGCGIKGSAEIVDYLNKFNINIDKEVVFLKGKTNIESVYNCCIETKEIVLNCFKEKLFPLVIGGDHSIAIGSISSTLQNYDTSIFWIDAHPDLETPENSITKRIHGMPVATLMKNGYSKLSDLTEDKVIKKENLIFLGVRDFDPYEKQYLSENSIDFYTANCIQKNSVEKILKEIQKKEINFIHISLDLDVINPSECPGVNTPVEEGLTYSQVREIIDFLFDNYNVVSMDIVEYNPLNDKYNRTVKIIKEIVESVKEKVSQF